MNPLVIAQLVTLALASAPQAIALAQKLKETITELFKAGVISKEAQDALHLYVDGVQAMSDAGIIPDHWKVEPDPA